MAQGPYVVDDRHMRRALNLAQGHRTHPNPKVGAVVLSSGGDMVGEGAHTGAGNAHAEVVALEAAGEGARGGTLFVTLEPCTHHGRTPPCVDAILSAGLARVIVAITDPDPRASGAGIRQLSEAGVEVVENVMSEEAEAINRAYLHHRRTGLPLVTMKWAMTLDGAVAAADGTSRWVSSDESRADAHGLRADVDAVVIGAGTVRADDPMLNVRSDGYGGPQPTPVIIAGSGDLPGEAGIWRREPVVVSHRRIEVPSGVVVVVEELEGMPDPNEACRAIADLGHLEILLEGGPTLAAAWWGAGVVSRGVIYLAPKIGGGAGVSPLSGVFESIGDAEIVSITGVRSLGPDYRIDFSRK